MLRIFYLVKYTKGQIEELKGFNSPRELRLKNPELYKVWKEDAFRNSYNLTMEINNASGWNYPRIETN
jgi:hypothetical protein